MFVSNLFRATTLLGLVSFFLGGMFAFAPVASAGPNDATIVAYSVVCDNEADLPNWGPWGLGGGDDRRIDPADVEAFIAGSNGACDYASDWSFEWGAEYPYPDDSVVGYSGTGNLFGPTNGSGVATALIPATDEPNDIWFRVARDEDYYGYNGKVEDAEESGEFYCHTDLWHYDNLEVVNVVRGETYYCVSFNALIGGAPVEEEPETPSHHNPYFNWDFNSNFQYQQPNFQFEPKSYFNYEAPKFNFRSHSQNTWNGWQNSFKSFGW